MLTFLRPRSLDLAQDVAATLTWGGVGWGCQRSFGHVPSTLHKMLMLRSHGVGWGGVEWGDVSVHPTLHKTLMLHQWGGVDGVMTTFIRLCARL